MKKIILNIAVLSIFCISLNTSVLAFNKQDIDYRDRVYCENINSMRMHLDEWEVSYPVLNMRGGNKLLFSFDRIDSGYGNYYYTVIHCNADWTPSRLMFFEFAEGFEENQIRDYEPSYNTMLSYVHYNISIPNEDLRINKSGNYLLVVYEYNDNREKEIVITKRFMLYEPLIDIEGRVNAPAGSLERRTSHKLDFTVFKNRLQISDPFREINIVIMQNYQWHNKIKGIEPSFIDNDRLVYEYEERNQFKAANEFRYFTFHDTERLSERVEHIDFRHPYYYVRLFSDESNLFRRYSSYEDINGKYVIRTRRFDARDYPEIEADYAMVDFNLNYDVPVDNANVYIFGELSNWEISDEYKMTYSLKERAYQKSLLLKQGYYNYRYLLVHDNNEVEHTFFEGSHFETENDYLLFVYHRPAGRNYDRLVGFKKFNSRN